MTTPLAGDIGMAPDKAPRSKGTTLAARLLGPFDRWFSDNRRNISRPKLLFAVSALDVAIVTLAGLVATSVTGEHMPATALDTVRAVCIALAASAALNGMWVYSVSALHRPALQSQRILKALLVVFCALAGVGFLAGVHVFSPQLALTWMAGAALALITSRIAIGRVLERLRIAGRLVRRTVIVGGGQQTEQLIGELQRSDSGVQILGVFDDRRDSRSADSILGFAMLGTFDQLSSFCQTADVDLLVVSLPTTAEDRLLHVLQQLFTLPVDLRISALGAKLRFNARAYTHVGRVPMLAVMDKPLTDWDRVVKNIEDRVLGALILVLVAPVMALVALAIRLDSRGPILFKQKRYGFNNELIEVYKFRSMYVDQADAGASKLVTRDDPRVTRVGRFIRKASLDELPQLINVLKGEMSLVGPRPHATQAKAGSALYHDVVHGYFARHRVKPGVTGWAQIHGWRGETDTEEKILRRVEHDLHYIDNWSVLLDLYIIAMTPLSLVTGKNAY